MPVLLLFFILLIYFLFRKRHFYYSIIDMKLQVFFRQYICAGGNGYFPMVMIDSSGRLKIRGINIILAGLASPRLMICTVFPYLYMPVV